MIREASSRPTSQLLIYVTPSVVEGIMIDTNREEHPPKAPVSKARRKDRDERKKHTHKHKEKIKMASKHVLKDIKNVNHESLRKHGLEFKDSQDLLPSYHRAPQKRKRKTNLGK